MPNHDYPYSNFIFGEINDFLGNSEPFVAFEEPLPPVTGSASVSITDTQYGATAVELLGPDALALTQYDGNEEAVVVLSKDMIFELLGVLKSAVA
ncbi:hypothetical protein BSL82_03465 [Tardibacter chloracetimidivorans]|uniref:Uncharacterized protein n=1 Tax=Tardibacter chloracetimidivorans TaxID=1921510 RepID=A0A1L3ZS74_9SPHN|nr:hypothetical protein [Tardibacter chloracetimidivorans]API58476.1 hypothetical protein BSL82_03465 [Tardibacter chloracetimidivorans]